MDNEDYEGLIRNLEGEAENNPTSFRTKVFLMSISAYLVLLLLFLLMGLLIYGIYAISGPGHRHYGAIFGLTIGVIPAIYVTLRAFLIRLEPPAGTEVTRKTAPALFKVLDKMQKKLNGPVFHRVVINDEFNAAISQVPRFGLFGGYQNHLVLGLPFLYGSTTEEMLATIAHEYGHVAGNHGKLGSWVYRQRITFGAIHAHAQAHETDNWFSSIMSIVLDYAAPYFNAYTFVLSRQDEYEADNTATELIGAKANISGLIRGDLLGQWIHEEFWPKVYKQARTSATPLFQPYQAMRLAFHSNMDVWATEEKLQKLWRVPSDLSDTHPALSDRVLAIGGKPELPEPFTTCAADQILGQLATSLAKKMDTAWWKNEKEQWTKFHQNYTKAKSTIARLSAQPLSALSVQDLQELAFLTLDYETEKEAKPILAHMLKQGGGPYSKAEFEYGRILLNEKDHQGLDHLLTAATNDQTLVERAAEMGYYFLQENRSEEQASAWWDKLNDLHD